MKKTIELPPCPNEKVPVAEGLFHHIIDIQSRFGDYDLFGHVNNSVYLQMMDLAKVAYFEAAMGRSLPVKGEVVVVVNVNISFFSPALPGEALSVVTRCTRLSQHSFTLEQRVVNAATGDVKCIGTTVMAGFDTRTSSGIAIPSLWADSLRAMES